MASTPLIYRINNETLNVKNIICYLYFLEFNDIIPKFSLNFTDSQIEIIIIYSAHSTNLPLRGYTVIKYNMYTKKWISFININNHNSTDTIYNVINRDYPYLITNNLLKINMDGQYLEYVLESEYIEDILEPSLNKFSTFDSNFRNMYISSHLCQNIKEILLYRRFDINEQEYDNFYERYHEYEQSKLFEKQKTLIRNNNYNLPEELWGRIYYFYRRLIN